MNIMQASILGLVQGLTEFLPVSSSGHLMLLEKLFGISMGNSQMFDVLLHGGTLIAVIVVYWRRIWNMICHPIRSELLMLIAATVPIVAVTVLFRDFFEGAFPGAYLGFAFLMTTLILWLADLVGGLAIKRTRVDWPTTAVMGIMQAVAILPGISRSGAVISGGVACGLSRKRAADFAFLMSLPAILGAMVWEGIKIFMDGGLDPAFIEMGWTTALIGVGVAMVSGFFAIKFMLGIVRRVRLTWFGLYTGLLGVLILMDQYLFHFVF